MKLTSTNRPFGLTNRSFSHASGVELEVPSDTVRCTPPNDGQAKPAAHVQQRFLSRMPRHESAPVDRDGMGSRPSATLRLRARARTHKFPGGYGRRATPDPIPNSVVKPPCADGTAGATLWESRTLPGLCPPLTEAGFFLVSRRKTTKSTRNSPMKPGGCTIATDWAIRALGVLHERTTRLARASVGSDVVAFTRTTYPGLAAESRISPGRA